ncbi:MAG: hypothetical protein PHC28_01445, partial [Flavobacterium sp.]|uniref:hypothetical protein n=1 Tax=Flavobacterium sp. TaxID=239 RepID=UPI00262ACAA0
MVNKKGWIRIVEAVFAIMLLAGFLVFVVVEKNETSDFGDYAYNIESNILNTISKNETLRQDVLDGELTKINSFIESEIPNSLNFSTKICEIEDVCGLEIYPGEVDVYADSVLISSTLQ